MDWKIYGPVAVSAVAGVVAVATGVLMGLIAREHIVHVVVLLTLWFAANAGCTYCFVRMFVFEEFFRELVPALDKIRLIATELPFLRQTETEKIEKDARKVWVITHDFFWDLENENFADKVVHQNLLQGKEYRYLYPDTPQAHLKRERLEQRLKDLVTTLSGKDNAPLQVSFKALPADLMLLFPHEIVIYQNVSQRGGASLVAIVDVNGKRDDLVEQSVDQIITQRKLVDQYIIMFKHLEDGSWGHLPVPNRAA